jgi:hypothetical protein
LRECKITKFERCRKLIGEMSMLEKLQCRLDHETALYVHRCGCGLTVKKSYRGMIRQNSIPEILKTGLAWAEFLIETPLGIWDDILNDGQYRTWLRIAVCDGSDYRRPEWHRWVYGGERNPVLDRKYQPIDWFERLKRETRLEVAEKMEWPRGDGEV